MIGMAHTIDDEEQDGYALVSLSTHPAVPPSLGVPEIQSCRLARRGTQAASAQSSSEIKGNSIFDDALDAAVIGKGCHAPP